MTRDTEHFDSPDNLTSVVPPEWNPSRMPDQVPSMTISVLERRYLTDFEPARWNLDIAADDGARPLLREVEMVGLSREAGGSYQVPPQVLTAVHQPGQALVLAVFGDGARHHIFLGARRLTGRAAGSTEDYLNGQASLFHANCPGLELGPIIRLDGTGRSEFAHFLRAAPALAVVTGVPSQRATEPDASRSLDQLVGALGHRRYAVVVLAEPLDAGSLDVTIDRCRELKSDVHSLVLRTLAESRGETRSRSKPDEPASRAWSSDVPRRILELALFCETIGVLGHVGLFTGLVNPASLGVNLLRLKNAAPVPQSSTSRTIGASLTTQYLDAGAAACEALLQRHIDRLETARSGGWWSMSIFAAAESDGALESVTAALRGSFSGTGPTVDSVRVVRPASHLLRAAMTQGQSIAIHPIGAVPHPLGPTFDRLATSVTSDELAVVINFPRRAVPGLPAREVGQFALAAPLPEPGSIALGHVQDSMGHSLAQVTLTPEALNRHVFISGMTGYGKTTTAQSILLQAADSPHEIPFLVIEPAKAEYRHLAQHPVLAGRLNVYSIGQEPNTSPLRLNPFLPIPGMPILRHVDLLKAVFNAAFPMFAGMAYIIEESMLELYSEAGWDLATSENRWLGSMPTDEDLAELVPSLGDLHEKIEVVLNRKQYGREIHQNLGAALRSRIGSLLVGSKGLTLDARRSIPPRRIFSEPTVIELRHLGDDEEKAFVMALVLGLLYEYAEIRGNTADSGLQHLTLIEEAHRLLSASHGPTGSETPAARAKAVSMFTDMLAEMRAYGEGFIVADQIPTKLAPDVLKNSNVKILHRLAAPDDRSVAGGAINLSEAQSRHLATLRPGEAIVHDDRMASALLVKMQPPLDVSTTTPSLAPERPAGREYLKLNAACRRCPRPCVFLARARTIPAEESLRSVFEAVESGDFDGARRDFTRWRSAAQASDVSPPAELPGVVYCAVSQAGHRWAGHVVSSRGQAVGQPPQPGRDRLLAGRIAKVLAPLWWAWSGASAAPETMRKPFESAHTQLSALLHEQPPRELAPCDACPQRCHSLTRVSAALTPELSGLVRARSTAQTPVDTRIRALRDLPALTLSLEAIGDAAEQSRYLYCLVTVSLAGAEPESAAEVLERLRVMGEPGRPSTRTRGARTRKQIT